MTALPTGTVTLLFTDIEGSTLLLRRLGERYGEVLSQQRAILRSCFARHDGHELGTEGDSFFVAFAGAGGAVAACVEAQLALAAAEWPDGAEVRVRMGLHTGEPVPHEDGYMGMDVHRAARIASSGHGGQIVLSAATSDLVADKLAEGAALTDLGWHHLKDLPRPERIYQLVSHGMASHFPPLKSLGSGGNLPAPITELVGRDADVAALVDSLGAGGARLVTLLGPGGVGKTRVAIAAASAAATHFTDGVYFVSMAAATEANALWKVLADELRVRNDQDVPVDAVRAHLESRHTLLVLDNLEHLVGVGSPVAAILAAAPRVSVLATSRQPLHVTGEHEHPLAPFELPPKGTSDLEVAGASAAVQLFVQYARMVKPSFTLNESNWRDVIEICRRLDGLPLAIELAAVRVKLLSPSTLLARLGSRLAIGASGADRPERQQNLRRTIAWSYELLTPTLQAVLRRTSIFVGGCDLAAFEAVAVCTDSVGPDATQIDPLEALTSLADTSLVVLGEMADGEPRVTMLETVREFAHEELERQLGGEVAVVRDVLVEWYLRLAEAAAGELTGPDQLSWLDRLEVEHDNLRAALEWSASRPGDRGLRMAAALWRFWWVRGHATEGRAWLEQVVANHAGGVSAARAAALYAAGELTESQADYGRAEELFERALAERQLLDDDVGVAECWNGLGIVARATGRLEQAEAFHEQALEVVRATGDQRGVAVSLGNLAAVAYYRGDLLRAGSVWEEVVGIARDLGDLRSAAMMLGNVGAVRLAEGDAEGAVAAQEEVLSITRTLNDIGGMAHTLVNLGEALFERGELERAEAAYDEALDLSRQISEPRTEATVLHGIGKLAQSRGDLALAAEHYSGSLAVFSTVGEAAGVAGCLERLGGLAIRLGDHERGVRLFGAAARIREHSGTTPEGHDQLSVNSALEAARAELGAAGYDTAWQTGQKQSQDAITADTSAVVSSAADAPATAPRH